jgi:nudix-type nucleoside diphosphatase (YffH/AdpP family)
MHGRAQGMLRAQGRRRPRTGPPAPEGPVEVLERAFPHLGFNRMEAWRIDHPRFDGARSGPLPREVAHVGEAATVLPYDPARDRVLLVEQLRMGALSMGDPDPWMVEPVAGFVDAGEDPAEAARREAREEAGLDLAPEAVLHVSSYYPSPGALAQVLHSYVALADLPDEAAGRGGLASEAEDIRGRMVGFDALMGMVASGEAANAPLLISALWLAGRRDRLRRGAAGV